MAFRGKGRWKRGGERDLYNIHSFEGQLWIYSNITLTNMIKHFNIEIGDLS